MQCALKCGREISGEEEEGICVACWIKMDEDAEGKEYTSCDTCNNLLIYPDELALLTCRECREENSEDAPEVDMSGKGWQQYQKGKGKLPHVPTIKCSHSGMPEVFTIGTGKVYASGERDYNDWDTSKIDLIVALNGHPESTMKVNASGQGLIAECGGYEKFPGLKPAVPMPYISIDWSDGGIPPISENFIQDLCKLVSSGTNILVHCVGGHGRTGTLLTAMLATIGRKGDILKWLRKKYCVKAVETKRQIEWLEDTYNLKTKEKPIWGVSPVTNWNPHNSC